VFVVVEGFIEMEKNRRLDHVVASIAQLLVNLCSAILFRVYSFLGKYNFIVVLVQHAFHHVHTCMTEIANPVLAHKLIHLSSFWLWKWGMILVRNDGTNALHVGPVLFLQMN